jgi:putative ABC transport system permease protein
MNFRTLIFRSLRFHARSHLGTLLGATIGSAILIGALAVGDSVRESLREMALARLGKTDFALTSNDRFFRAKLADDLRNENFHTAAALQLTGIAANDDDSARANHVRVLGVNDNFWKLAQRNPNLLFTNETIAVNESLARQLNAKVGETILLRVPKPSLLSRDAPISPREDSSIAFRLTLAAILSDDELGNFNLRASQIPPNNAFVSQKFLQEKLGLSGKANLLMVSATNQNALAELQNSLAEKFQLADAGLELRPVTNQNILELRSARVFLDPPVVDAALKSAPDARLISTYFVNELRIGNRVTPYSMVAAARAPLVPDRMSDDEILINQWLADDLHAKAGDELRLRYFVMGADQRLEEKTNSFRVRGVVPLAGIYADRELMPEFPGVAKAEKTEDWDAGFDIDMKKIRPKDEQYWENFRGTPKAFVTLAAGEKMWSNRFGTFTAIRFPNTDAAKVQENIRRHLDPKSLGFVFQPAREQALAASSQSEDFGGLFLGFSFFLIVAALILVALLFQFSLEQRATEIGTLLALGFRAKQIRRLLLGEGAAIAFIGGILGMLGGIYYAKGMLLGLTTLWHDAVGTSSLKFHVTPMTLGIGCVASLLVSIFTIWLALRNQAKRPAHELLSQGAELEIADSKSPMAKSRNWSKWISAICGVGAIALVAWAISQKENASPEIFFEAGALLLIAGIAFAANFLKRLGATKRAAELHSAEKLNHADARGITNDAGKYAGASTENISAALSGADMSLTSLGIRSCARRRKRSLATIGLLACGSFLVVAVAANKLDANKDSHKRSSGTGGFAWIGETSLPVVQDLNTNAGRNFFGLGENDLKGVSFVPFRVREGDDASCLNLNRAQTPKLLGVKPELLASRNAFAFSKVLQEVKEPWLLLKSSGTNPDAIPAIGDANSIQWALHKKVGDVIEYTDEHGNKFNVEIVGAIANSILQGSLIIDEAEFVKRFPSTSGYRMFLIDAPQKSAAELHSAETQPNTTAHETTTASKKDTASAENISAALSRALRDVGLELTPTEQRLAQFNAVQNTYLNTFQILGGLGLLLGSVGLGIVVLRNVLERRSELAVLLAIGFRKRSLRWLVLSEHAALLWLGIALGVFAALVAVLPALLSPRGDFPYASLAITLGAVLLSGMIWTWAATSLALRGELLEALRNN